MELFFEGTEMQVDELQVFNWKTIALIVDGKKTFYKSETGWDVDTGFELRVTRRPRA